MQIICTSLQTDNHASISSLSCLQAGCSSWCPTNSVKALKANPLTKTDLWFSRCSVIFQCVNAVGYLSGARCKWFAYGPADATATPSSLAAVKFRMVYLSGADLPRLSWKKRLLNGCSSSSSSSKVCNMASWIKTHVKKYVLPSTLSVTAELLAALCCSLIWWMLVVASGTIK